MNAIFRITRTITSLVYPIHCPVCRRALAALDETGVCSLCLGNINRSPGPHCYSCGRSMRATGHAAVPEYGIAFGSSGHYTCADCRLEKPAFTTARSACLYEGAIKELIHIFKYKNRRSLSGILAAFMTDVLKDEHHLAEGIDAVTFVPLHKKRLRERDFNQSEALGRIIASRLALPAIDCLEKIRRTASQNELPREGRLVNLKGAFKIRGGAAEPIRSKRLLLVDDVMTTGATLEECSRTLLNSGANEVRCLTLARGA